MSGSVNVDSYMTGYNNQIDFDNIESFVFNSGSGNDNIDLGYDNFSDDAIDAGAGDDFINAGLGNDNINGGRGFDVLRLDFGMLTPEMRVFSELTNSESGEYEYGENTIKFRNIEAIEVMGSENDDVLVALTGNHNLNEPVLYPMESRIDGRGGQEKRKRH